MGSLGIFPDPECEPRSPASQADSLLSEPPGSPRLYESKLRNIQKRGSARLRARVARWGTAWDEGGLPSGPLVPPWVLLQAQSAQPCRAEKWLCAHCMPTSQLDAGRGEVPVSGQWRTSQASYLLHWPDGHFPDKDSTLLLHLEILKSPRILETSVALWHWVSDM